MPGTAANVLLDTRNAWGVDAILGLPRNGIYGSREALRTGESCHARIKPIALADKARQLV